jgi:hypothetical protein
VRVPRPCLSVFWRDRAGFLISYLTRIGAKKHHLPRRHLEGPELVVLWSLRLYLLFMMAVAR